MKNNKSRDQLLIIFSIALTLIVTLTVVYAALATTLRINGNAEVTAANWNIHLDNVKVNENSIGNKVPTITSPTTATFTTTLTNPGDFYEFTIDVVNNGTIDAMIDSVEKKPTLTEEQAKYMNYIIEYQNGESISAKQLVQANSFVRLKVRVEFRNDVSTSDLPTSSQTINLSFKVIYIQSDENTTNVSNNGIKIPISANGDINDIGTIVTIGTEQFYTIGTEGENVKLLSMYNLYVSGDHDGATLTVYGDEATGMQDSTMLGYVDDNSMRKGVTKYSNAEMNITYSGSIVEGYVNNYKNNLESMFGINVTEARLITYEELSDTSTFNLKTGTNSDIVNSPYNWIASTSYWTMSPYQSFFSNVLYTVNKANAELLFYTGFDESSKFGVRPVIVISKDYF